MRPRPVAAEPGGADRVPVAVAWAGVAALTVTAALAGLLEAVLVPLYLGSYVFPIAVVAALISNIALPRMSRALVPSTLAAALPFLAWLVVVLGFGAVARPEGDVILPGGGALMYVSYGVMLGGALAGTVSVITSTPLPARRTPLSGGTAAAPSGGNATKRRR